jgi:hypothetical protein
VHFRVPHRSRTCTDYPASAARSVPAFLGLVAHSGAQLHLVKVRNRANRASSHDQHDRPDPPMQAEWGPRRGACRPASVYRVARRLPHRLHVGTAVMGWIRRPRSGRGWEARYRGPDGKERSRSFSTKRRAQEFLAISEAEKHRGDWRDPALARTSLGEWVAVLSALNCRWRTRRTR